MHAAGSVPAARAGTGRIPWATAIVPESEGNIVNFSQQLRDQMRKQYEGILPEKAIQGCLDFWEAVAVKIRNEALEEAAEVADAYGRHGKEIAEQIRKLKEGS